MTRARRSGIKRHIAVDTQGFPHAVAVTTAEVTDRTGALEAFKRCKSDLKPSQQRADRQWLHGQALYAFGLDSPQKPHKKIHPYLQ